MQITKTDGYYWEYYFSKIFFKLQLQLVNARIKKFTNIFYALVAITKRS